jgi:Rps23 Pro-64 3,4-dihydroxylase Tpa1-like proline 4-hydroxylase
LLCHDDVIGNRKISFIIYLTDPEDKWNELDGGQLEFYDSTGDGARRVPNPFPVKTLLPTFNSMAYFAVRPGESFHSVQEVFCDKPRLSIQGKPRPPCFMVCNEAWLNYLLFLTVYLPL